MLRSLKSYPQSQRIASCGLYRPQFGHFMERALGGMLELVGLAIAQSGIMHLTQFPFGVVCRREHVISPSFSSRF